MSSQLGITSDSPAYDDGSSERRAFLDPLTRKIALGVFLGLLAFAVVDAICYLLYRLLS